MYTGTVEWTLSYRGGSSLHIPASTESTTQENFLIFSFLILTAYMCK